MKLRNVWILGIAVLMMVASYSSGAAIHGNGQHEHHGQEQSKRDRDRWMWQLPERVLDAIGLEEGMQVADVGAGEGYFTSRLAKRVGKDGTVYANEIDEALLRRVSSECKAKGFTNVVPVQGAADDPKLPEKALDIVLMVNVTHFLEEPEVFFRRLKTSLREGGRLAIVQWDATKMSIEDDMSPSDMEKFSEEAVLVPLEAAGFEIVAKETFLPVQNLYICQPK